MAVMSSVLPIVAVALLLVVVASADVCNPVTRQRSGHHYRYIVDPWIVPSTNTTNGSLPPGSCPFSSYPVINATCKDTITFVTRAIPAGLRVHGVYLLDDVFVDQKTGAYRCPSTAVDVDLRNGTGGGFANPAACRGVSITQVLIDGTKNFTAPFVASGECVGYTALDTLDVYVPTAPHNCSTSSVIVGPVPGEDSCFQNTTYRVQLKNLVKKHTPVKYLVFSCPNISGNQPGTATSHCHAKMSLVVRVTCN